MQSPATVQSNASGGESAGNGTSHSRKQGTKRAKYALRACLQCKRRKVKCSGEDEDACQQCRSRGLQCCSSPVQPGSRDRNAPDARVARESDRVDARTETERYSSMPQTSAVNHTTNPQADPRFDGLCERVRALENTLAQLLQSGNLASNVSAEPPVHHTVTDDEERDGDGDDNANQFVAGATALDDISLSSQVAAMRALVSSPSLPEPSSRRSTKAKARLLVRLPDPGSMQHLLDVYFRDCDSYFPFLDRRELESRMYGVIRRLGYSAHNTVILVHVDDAATVALMCIMMALAESLDPGEEVCDGDSKPGWERYLMFRRAEQRLLRSGPLDLDVVRAQALAAAYLMHCEALEAASQAVTVVWQLAVTIRLNNQKVWPEREAKETLQRQQLWWTIYFLDRQISRRSGIPYHIRDTEFDVDDFAKSEHTGDGGLETPPLHPSTISKSYMQGLINLARLWGNVWDTLFAVGATKTGDWMEIEIMDARILNTRRQLPDTLTWDPNKLASYTLNGEDEPHIRRRLQLYTRLDLLRMLIRQNPVRQVAFSPETAHLCASLARQIIEAHDLFISRYPEDRATGYFTTSSIVECIYHLALVLHHSKDEQERATCASAFRVAHDILVKISSYNEVANKALKALTGVINKWCSGNETRADGAEGENGVTGNILGIPLPNPQTGVSVPWPQYNPHFQGSRAQYTAAQPGNFDEADDPFGTDRLGVNPRPWMDISMDSLLGSEYDFHFENWA